MTSPRFATEEPGRVGRYYDIPGFPDIAFVSVTNILASVAKPALYGWNARLAAECAVREEAAWHAIQEEQSDKDAIDYIKRAPRRVMERAGDVGTRVHRACEAFALGKSVECLDDITPYVQQFERFCEANAPQFIHVERTVANPKHAYAGTLDMVVDMGEGLCVGDIKTGGIYSSAALQLCSYARATHQIVGDATVEKDWKADRAFVLELKPRTYKVHWCDISERTWEAFLNIRRLRAWQDDYEKGVFL